jgi:hypothetical protein
MPLLFGLVATELLGFGVCRFGCFFRFAIVNQLNDLSLRVDHRRVCVHNLALFVRPWVKLSPDIVLLLSFLVFLVVVGGMPASMSMLVTVTLLGIFPASCCLYGGTRCGRSGLCVVALGGERKEAGTTCLVLLFRLADRYSKAIRPNGCHSPISSMSVGGFNENS